MPSDTQDKDCFDNCKITKCLQNGHDVAPPDYCLADPMIDRYERRKPIKKPCNTCIHREVKKACIRCIHNLVIKATQV